MRTTAAILMIILLTSCASMKLKPYSGALTKTYTKDTTLSKSESYENVSAWLAKKLTDTNSSIKIKDSETGRIIAKIIYPCVGLKRPDVVISVPSTDVSFNVDASFKEKRIKLELEMIGFTRDLGSLGHQSYFIADSPGQDIAIGHCFDSLEKDLLEGLEKSNKNW